MLAQRTASSAAVLCCLRIAIGVIVALERVSSACHWARESRAVDSRRNAIGGGRGVVVAVMVLVVVVVVVVLSHVLPPRTIV